MQTLGQFCNSLYLGIASLSQPVSLEQWHCHRSLMTIAGMSKGNLVEGLNISNDNPCGKCEDCMTANPSFVDRTTEKDLAPLELVFFNLWEPS